MAGKIKTVFVCSSCGAESPKWVSVLNVMNGIR